MSWGGHPRFEQWIGKTRSPVLFDWISETRLGIEEEAGFYPEFYAAEYCPIDSYIYEIAYMKSDFYIWAFKLPPGKRMEELLSDKQIQKFENLKGDAVTRRLWQLWTNVWHRFLFWGPGEWETEFQKCTDLGDLGMCQRSMLRNGVEVTRAHIWIK
ncbi:uncharacterized protein TRIVIDRAFT_226340 [Trichoderma virens Gv29-8]|uniref:Uncharacterized protein n=1 Tax=Hypocrea virens (strain Gv29-8 / FGSC 10586) TaxID=413071 RepID=G9N639_HYPVG|nr:uncharacterized protein TRIVIDRAFT_226340 [Trichoderma virens Gv29-8]EHK18230.1 hypothetical protein TRIVIDRAFT_226340 [Trichoderma virens Gv29-8]